VGAADWSDPRGPGRGEASTPSLSTEGEAGGVSARTTVSAPDLSSQRAALNRYRVAIRTLDESRIAFESSPSDLTADRVRWAEIELEDAIAVAGEFHVANVPWKLP
jgi:hypothetical protein